MVNIVADEQNVNLDDLDNVEAVLGPPPMIEDDEVLRGDPEKPDNKSDDERQREICYAMLWSVDLAQYARHTMKPSFFINKAHKVIAETVFARLDKSGCLPNWAELRMALDSQHRESKAFPHLLGELSNCWHYRDAAQCSSLDWHKSLIAKEANAHLFKQTFKDGVEAARNGQLDLSAVATALKEGIERINGAGAVPKGYRFDPMNSAAFAQAEYRLEWLVKGMLVKGQPCLLGGPKKSLKTNILVDMAISLGSGRPFLGVFPTARTRTILISGESGSFTIQETARRISQARGVTLDSLDTLWDFRLPRLSVADELSELQRGLKDRGIEVAIIDPLYLCLLSGGSGDAKNLFDMGPLLLDVANACNEAGCTPILAHHAKKSRNNPYDPMDLDDLAFAGVAEFARQWMLVSRREPYDPDTGMSKLYLSYGGSAGHGGLKAVDIREGILNEEFGGRVWDVTLRSLDELKEAKAIAKTERDDRKADELEANLMGVIDKVTPATVNKIRNYLGWGGPKTERILARLVGKGQLTAGTETVVIGNGATRSSVVYRGCDRTSEHADGTSSAADDVYVKCSGQ